MRVFYMGTPDFAVPCLERIIADGHEVCGVFTRPDKPRGRGYRLFAPPVKEAALKHGIPVFQPKTLKGDEAANIIRGFSPDVIVVTAYGRLLPESVLSIPPLGCVNVHASLLPKYRGAAPMQWALINGEKTAGITTMYMAKGMDEGDMILQRAVEVGADENFGELHDVMMELGAELLSETLGLLSEGKAPRVPQPQEGVTLAPLIDKQICALDFKKQAQDVHNLVRGLSPVPGAVALLRGEQVKIFRTAVRPETGNETPGTVTAAGSSIVVQCGDGTQIEILEIQQQGGKRMPAQDYLRGHPIKMGERFEHI